MSEMTIEFDLGDDYSELCKTSKKEQGIITLTRELINQDGKVVQTGVTPIMIQRR